MTETDIVRTLAVRFYWPGADPEDVEQEAWFALERCRPKWKPEGGRTFLSWAWVCIESHLRELRRRERYRRPQFAELQDVHPASGDLVDRIEARRLLRLCLEYPLAPKERRAVNGAIVGERHSRDGSGMDTARWRGRKKLRAAA